MSLPTTIVNDFYLEVLRGNVSGFTAKELVGVNADIDAGTEDIWAQGGSITQVSTAAVLYASSSEDSDLDTVVTITGLDTNYDEITENITLTHAGAETPKAGLKAFLRVNSVTLSAACTGDVYVFYGGVATVGVPDTASTIQAKIPATVLVSTSAIYTVPRNKNLYMTSLRYRSTGAGTAFNVIISAIRKVFGGSNETIKTIKYPDLGTTNYTDGQVQFTDYPVLFPAKSEIRFAGTLQAGGDNLNLTIEVNFVEETIDAVPNTVTVYTKVAYLAYLAAGGPLTISSVNYWLIGLDEMPGPNVFPTSADLDDVLTTITGTTGYIVAANTDVFFDAAYYTGSGKLVTTTKKAVLTLMRCVDSGTGVKYVLAPVNTVVNIKNVKKISYLNS